MRRLIGFILFWMAFGMFLMLLLHNSFLGWLLVFGLLMIGYNLFCC